MPPTEVPETSATRAAAGIAASATACAAAIIPSRAVREGVSRTRNAEQFAERPVVAPDLADGHVDGRTEKRQLPDPAASGPQGRQRLPGPVAECRDDPYAPDGYVHLRFLRI